jgi:hypothetical protein
LGNGFPDNTMLGLAGLCLGKAICLIFRNGKKMYVRSEKHYSDLKAVNKTDPLELYGILLNIQTKLPMQYSIFVLMEIFVLI